MHTQRKEFAQALLREMQKNDAIWVLTGDLGYGMWDQIQQEHPQRFINVGSAEQAMLDIAIGLAFEGKIPFVYSISSFVLYRSFESIRNYVNREIVPVKLIGAGRKYDYAENGFSHWAPEDKRIMKIFTNVKPYWPSAKQDISVLVHEVVHNKLPCYINLRR